ncbi:hypothetical protein BO99DRAFT_152118 [Aspergillus violaceofuscus CBS 115571]|uniref:Uncharacterized protein n=1 Tax=Aspergillus violaceofuscus (strain CBS 115571) TaxID=1450538 RepID=A0A2V5HH50_ASPV1|nr:hypothetical protein BO99DRAFT_152118 [Aspergillus violaceofuscus CBS 115571]
MRGAERTFQFSGRHSVTAIRPIPPSASLSSPKPSIEQSHSGVCDFFLYTCHALASLYGLHTFSVYFSTLLLIDITIPTLLVPRRY